MASKVTNLLTFAILVSSANASAGVDMVQQNWNESNWNESINALVVENIELELQKSLLYQAYATYFQRADVSLPGIQRFFATSSLDSRGHAQHLIDYVIWRGGSVKFEEINLKETCNNVQRWQNGDDTRFTCTCDVVINQKVNKKCVFEICDVLTNQTINQRCPDIRTEWQEGLMAFRDVLKVEEYVNQKLLDLHEKADIARDADLAHRLEHILLGEQVWTIYELCQHCARFRTFGSGSGKNYKVGEFIFDNHLQKHPALPTAEIMGDLSRPDTFKIYIRK